MMADLSSDKESPPQSIQVTEGIVEPEDKQTSSSGSTSSTPPWVRWSRGLHSLLDDAEGVELFELYLSQEGCSAQLNFLWACEGLKSTGTDDPPKIPQLIRSIYRNLIQNSNLLGVTEETRSEIAQGIKDGKFNTEIFDKAQAEVEMHMQDNLYPNFIKSEIFLSVATGELETSTRSDDVIGSVSSLESGSVGAGANVSASASLSAADRSQSQSTTDRILSGVASKLQVDPLTGEILHSATVLADGELSPLQISGPSTPPNAANLLNLLPNQLQTVHEDKELSVNLPPASHNAKVKLTKEGLWKTHRARAKARATAVTIPCASTSLGNGKVRKGETLSGHYYTNKGAHAVAPFPYHVMYSAYNPVSRVDSEIQSMSSDAMTDDGGHTGHHHSSSKKHGHHHHKSQPSQSQMPPSSRHLDKLSQFQAGAALAGVQNRDNLTGLHALNRGMQAPKMPQEPAEFAANLIRKLEEVKKRRELEEQLNKRISERDEGPCRAEELTSHVLAAAIEKLQVQDEGLPDDILDQHVSRIWADITPDPRSPKLIRSPIAGRRRGVVPHQLGSGALLHRQQRRERDVLSTFSADSGNVNDYAPEAPNSPSIMFVPKSRSVPFDLKGTDEHLKKLGDPSQFPMPQAQRERSSRGGGFVQSDPRKISATMLTKKSSNEYLDSGISVISGTAPPSAAPPAPAYDWSRHSMVNQWVEQACDEKPRVRSTTSPTVSRRQKKVGGSASSSQSQPSFQPTPTLEEVCRRLNKKPPGYPTQHQLPGTYSSSSTLPRRHHSQPHSSQEEPFGVAEFSVSSFVFYEDSEVPYGFKIPCKSRAGGITLAVFKEHLPKRGHFRFFFKKECAELDTKVVQEEVTDDCQILPLYEGKIIAHLQAATPSSSSLQQNAPLL